jgi:hypothetical protein
MKANKVVKRLSKIEDLLSDVLERYSTIAPHVAALLQDAKAAVARATDAVDAVKVEDSTIAEAKPQEKPSSGAAPKSARKPGAANRKASQTASRKMPAKRKVATAKA